MFCSSKSLTIKIHDNYILCPRSGGKIEVEGYGGFLLCPDYNLICSGTKMCNDMFDCVEKKSEAKNESYVYDYEIKTSQSIEKAYEEESDKNNNYELSDDGLCPKYCELCNENKECLKCSGDYKIVLDTENNTKFCLSSEELSLGYFKKENDIYMKCIDNCDYCNDERYCEKCKDDFAFKENNREECFSKKEFENGYYTKDEEIYYECNGINEGHISGCKECTYNSETQNLTCDECLDNHSKNKETNTCEKKEENNDSNNFKYINFKTSLLFLILILL